MQGLRIGTRSPRRVRRGDDGATADARERRRPAELRWRFRFTLLTVGVTVLLISWGGFVTSIEAGMAVPDWPQTFGSWNPVNPVEGWWRSTPLLAEHGHRILGQVVGALTLTLAGWTWWRDARRWMRYLAGGALALVVVQGVLGGLRVTENSLALATVHACTAQIFFSLLVAMALFTSRSWLEGASASRTLDRSKRRTLVWLLVGTGAALYGQIVLGALLRHFGRGIGQTFAVVHIGGAFAVTALVVASFVYAEKHFDHRAPLRRGAWAMVGAVFLQFALGLAAYLVLLNDMARSLRSTLQIGLTAGHLVVGAFLMAATVATALLSIRAKAAPVGEGTAPTDASALRERA
ncbi:MAG: cytochrome oxidase assembly protein [Bacteroidetes bacterium QS_8_68_15]|nr:MAG: cytochrome oxidase assembly protein [Bacteroidetes bacterium QS_8_68_15]